MSPIAQGTSQGNSASSQLVQARTARLLVFLGVEEVLLQENLIEVSLVAKENRKNDGKQNYQHLF